MRSSDRTSCLLTAVIGLTTSFPASGLLIDSFSVGPIELVNDGSGNDPVVQTGLDPVEVLNGSRELRNRAFNGAGDGQVLTVDTGRSALVLTLPGPSSYGYFYTAYSPKEGDESIDLLIDGADRFRVDFGESSGVLTAISLFETADVYGRDIYFSQTGFNASGVQELLFTEWPDIDFSQVARLELKVGRSQGIEIVEFSTAGPALPGDYDNSGLVDQADLDLVLQNWGMMTDGRTRIEGWVADLPRGLVEQTELDRVLQNWGDALAPPSKVNAVPEPGMGTLGISVALLFSSRFTARRRGGRPPGR